MAVDSDQTIFVSAKKFWPAPPFREGAELRLSSTEPAEPWPTGKSESP